MRWFPADEALRSTSFEKLLPPLVPELRKRVKAWRDKLRQTRPFVAKEQGYLISKKSVFNRLIGDGNFELRFAHYLEDCEDIISYAKNYLAVHFKLDYVNMV